MAILQKNVTPKNAIRKIEIESKTPNVRDD